MNLIISTSFPGRNGEEGKSVPKDGEVDDLRKNFTDNWDFEYVSNSQIIEVLSENKEWITAGKC